MRPLVFLAPEGLGPAGLGRRYAERLLALLPGAGFAPRRVEPGDALPDGPLLVDAMAAGALPPDRDDATLLVHHPGAGGLDALRAALPRVARVLCSSEETASRLREAFGVAADRLHVVVPGTDPQSRAAGSGGPGCALLSVGDLVPRKGHEALLEALARLPDLDWTLAIVGAPDRDPIHAASLRVLADRPPLAGRVRFLGREETGRAWDRADAFALASRHEAYGLVVAEALARGLPVATTAAAALVPEAAGVVCQPGETEQLSRGLRRLIFDPRLRASMAEAAWQAGRALPRWETQVARVGELVSNAT